ncbi:MAG: Rad52/Rad22 family DNA repair protein [Turicibacter sp.]
MDLKELSKPLPITSIDFRVQSVNKGGYAIILAYKDARVDMQRLDEVCGALNWRREHTRDNHNCIVSIYDKEKQQWVYKEDTGTESNTEKDKGLASDSFKRACFNWGIGRELYDYPIIQVKLRDDEFDKATGKPTFNFKLKDWKWFSQFEGNVLTYLGCKDEKGNVRFQFGTLKKQ